MCAITGNVETWNPATHRVEQRAATEFAADPVKVESRQLDDVLSNLARTNAEVSVLGSIPEHAKPAWLKVFERDPEYKEKLQAASYMTGLLPQLREAEKEGDLIRAAQLLGSYDAVSRWAENALSGDEADYMERLRRRLDKAGVEIIPSAVNKPFTGDTPDLRATSAFHDDALFPGETIVAACTAAGVRRGVIGMDPVVTPAEVTVASHTVRNPELKYNGRTFIPARVTVNREKGSVRIFTYDEPISGDSRQLGRELFPDLPDRKVYETEISIRAYDRMLRDAGWEYTFDEESGRRIWLRPEAEKEVTDAIEKESRTPENKPSEPGEPQEPRQSERTEQPVAEVPAGPNRDSQSPRETSDISETPAESDIRPAEPQQPQPSQPTSETPQKPAAPPAPVELRPEDSVFIGGQEVPIMFINPDGSVETLSVLPINEKSVEDNGRYYTTFTSREALENAAEHRPDGSLRVIRDGKELLPESVQSPEPSQGTSKAERPTQVPQEPAAPGEKTGKYDRTVPETREAQKTAISRVIDFARKVKDKIQRAVIAGITKRQSEDFAELGLDIDETWVHSFESSAFGHNQKEHGDSKVEDRRGQIAITEEDYARIPEILDSYDRVSKSPNRTHSSGNEVIIYEKEFDDGYVYYLEEKRDRRQSLAFQTMYKKKKGTDSSDGLMPDASPSTPLTPSDNLSSSSDRKVNTKSTDTQIQAEKTAGNTSETPRLQKHPEAEPADVRGLRDGADRAQRDIDALEKQIESHRAKEPSRLSAGTSYEEKHAKWQQRMDELQDQLPPLRELVLKWRAKADRLEEEQRQAEERRIIAEGGIPEDADGNWQFHKVTPEHTYRFLTERQGYTADDVIATADANIDAKEPKKPKLGANAKANAEKLQDYNRRLEEFNRNREYWQQVKETAVRDKAEAEKAAEAARAEEIRRQEEARRRAEEEAARRAADLRITLRQRDGETSYQISRHDVLEAAGRPRGMFDVAKTASHWHFGGLYDSDGRGSFLFPDSERAEAFLKAAEQYPGDPQAFEKAARELAERRDDGLFHKGEKYTVGEDNTTLEILSPRSLRGDYEVSVDGHKGIFKESQLQKILKPETLPEQPDTETASEPTQGYGNSPLPNFMQAVRALYQKGKKAAAQLFQMSFFDVTKTPEFMKVLGLKGEKFTIRFGVISRHFGKDSDHKLPEDIWEQLPEALQRPFAISKHFEEKNGEKKQKGYRIYTTLKHNDRYVIVGAEVKNIGRNLEINAIETAFAIKKPSESEDFIYTSETITPEQQSLLNGRNSRQYPVAQGLSADKGTTNSTTGQTNSENSAETASEPAAGRRQRGPELTPSLFGPAQPRHRAERTPSLFRFKTESEPQEAESKAGSVRERQSDKADKPAESELTEEQQQSADRANAAIDRYVDAFAEHIERTKDIPDDIPDDISAPFYDARDRALDAIADHYRALGNTEADARRMARDQLTTVTAEASVRLNRKPATLPAEEGVPYRPAEKTEAGPDAKAYRSASGEVIEYSSSDGLPRKEQGEFALVERKFVSDGYFGFTGSETVETADDVAYLFRQLENHATEHAFVLLVKDGRPTVVHIGQGSFDVTLVNFGAIWAANDALGGADGIYFVHNHPSGNLTASGPDLNIMHTIERMFPKKALGIIIDTTSGKYLQFSAIGLDSETARPDQARGAEKPYTVNNFDRQVFSPEYDFGTLRQIRDESDVAAYVSTLRLGARDKISFLVLDRANKVTGNFHTDFDRHSDQEEMADMMIRQALRFGGTSVIMYGNERALRPERAVRDAFSAQMKDIFKRKSGDSVRFLDNVSVKNGLDSSGQSASEPAPTYGTDKNEAGRSEAALKHLEPSSTGNDAAKVLKDVETSYDSGKFLLQESEKASNSPLVRFRDGETPLSGAEPAVAERDLVAVHNLTEENLADALGLGGFPMPSVAVTKAGMEHKDYGPVSLVFGRESIDPARRGNKVYSGDAWTPVFPETGYKLNGKKTNEIYGRANGAGALPLFNPTDFHPDNYERRIDRRGDRSLMESFRDSYSAKQLFLSEKGNPVTEMVRTRVEKYTPGRITLLEDIVKTIGVERLLSESDDVLAPEVRGLIEKHDPSALEGKKPFVVKAKINNAILEAVDYAENGNIAVKADTDATRAEIDKRVNQKEFETWLSDMFSGVVEKKGIRNERDPFTPSGSSRPWEALYDEITLDNVVRAMRRQADKGGQGFFGSSIFGASTRELRDIDDVRREAAARISSVPREEYEAEKKQIVERLSKVTLPSVARDFSRAMDFVENVNEAVAKSHGTDGIYRHLKEIYPDMTRAVAEEIGGIVADIQKMATRYLEAKPRRAVGLGEVRLAVVPEGTAPEVVRQLESRGIPVRTYEPGNERQRADIISRETADRGLRFRRQTAGVQKRDSGTVPTPREARAAVPVLDLAVRDTRARLDAAGDPQERRELQEQLDQLLEEQDAYATGRAPQTPAQRAGVRRAAETTAAALGEKVIIHTTAAGISHPDAAVRARMRRAKGWYDAATGEVHINAFNHATEADVARTMLHESIGHKALRDFYGEGFDRFLDEIYSSAEESIRRQIASRMGSNGWNVREATEEYMATLAETVDRHGAEHLDTATRRTWQRAKTAVKRTLNRILEKAGLTTHVNLTDRDLSYLLWRQYRSRRKAGALEAAENRVRLEALKADPESFAPEKTYGYEKTPVAGQPNRANEKLTSGSILLSAKGDSSSNANVPSEVSAKVTNNTQSAKNNIRKFINGDAKMDLSSVNNAFKSIGSLFSMRSNGGSRYTILRADNGDTIALRLSDHAANGRNFGRDNADRNVSIVIERRKFNTPGSDIAFTEVTIPVETFNRRPSETVRAIVEGVDGLLRGEEFSLDPSLGTVEKKGNASDATYRFRDGDREAAADPATAEETRSRRIFDLMVDMCNRNKDNVEYRDAARKTLTGRLATVARGMRLQRDFDRAQLAAVTDTCNKMIGLEILDTDSRADMARTIKAIDGSAGKEDLEDTAYRLLGIASHSQVRMARRRLDDLSRIRGTKTGDDRIQRQAGLDPEGQATAKAFRDFRKLPEQNIQTAMARVSERIAGDDVPESASMLAAAEMLGLRQALLHSQEDALHRDNLGNIEEALRDLKNQWDPSLSGDERRRYRQAKKSLGQQRIVEELRHADALGAIADSMGDTLQASKERVRIFREAEKERVNNIHHDANCDMQGRPAHADRPARSKLVNNTVTSFFLAPTMTFDQMLRMFGKHSANGEGYLYYRFMSGPQGWQACEDRRFKSKQAKERILDRKAAEILGKDKAHWADLYKLTRAEGCTLTYNSAGVEVERKVSQGNLMYIYMANKMTDGAVKLRHMNITEEDMDLVEEVLDPRLRQLADWIQDEFLPSTRDGYNEVHIRMFGAPMDYVENYFPLKITEGEIQKNVEIGEMMNDGEGDTPKILTGAIRKRVFNTRALNVLDSDPVAITLEHLEEMEDWAAFSEFRRDLGTLLSYRRFKNQVKNTTSVYGAGEKLWKRFSEVAQLTGGADQGMRSGMVGEVDKAVVNLCKLGTASRITYRVFTALKQFTSLPAFGSDTNLWNAIHSTATPRASWQWCMENLPSFEKRWVTRQAGMKRFQR